MILTPWRLLVLDLVACASCLQAQVGGGYTDGGIRGEYFANADQKVPAFADLAKSGGSE